MNTNTLLKSFFFIFFLLYSFSVCSQDFINDKEFSKIINKDIVVIEFYADWNEANKFTDLKHLKDCKTYRINIENEPTLKEDYTIKTIPTIIVFDNGKENIRYEADLSLKLQITKKDIQKTIEKIILTKFN